MCRALDIAHFKPSLSTDDLRSVAMRLARHSCRRIHKIFKLLWVAVLLAPLCAMATDVVQRPVVTSCMTGERLFTLTDFTIQDSKVGRYMRVNYTVEVHGGGGVVRSPAVKFTVHNSNNLRTPCVDDFGSCTYKACGGTKLTERMIGAGWNNSCKNIPNGVYQSSILLKVIPAVLLVFGNGTFNIQVEGISEKGRHECVSFDIFIEK